MEITVGAANSGDHEGHILEQVLIYPESLILITLYDLNQTLSSL